MFWSLPVYYEFHCFRSIRLVCHHSPVPRTGSGILGVNECLLTEYTKVQRSLSGVWDRIFDLKSLLRKSSL